ncbi:peptidyl-prolyl cis-trans isomerase [Zoogloea oryzae]|uniref:Peptidyl-prolyl cis-trans isomerase n=1 Tax=Zoogloea oryzae TaxID=310767 RepID=A0ABQ6FD89_9RHOO|nr:peptidylprolyl isomerase [Zoogloea oryzae]GLT22886.1 peptidyl-prolyl cis-trans isomerase [Zoogloea oryzae]
MKKILLAVALASQALIAAAANPLVEMKTSAGTIVLELYPEKAPKTVANFLEYAKSGFYDGLIFHRVIDGFMIQGGGMNAKMEEKATRAPVENEGKNGLKNDAGTIAMARTQDPNSATAQFFINLENNRPLNYPSPDGFGYAVFGKVTDGMDVVRKIGKEPTTTRGFHRDVPATPILIQSVRQLPEKQAK